jgi:hypothetical protein
LLPIQLCLTLSFSIVWYPYSLNHLPLHQSTWV